jgi:Tol biopolymer transport system component
MLNAKLSPDGTRVAAGGPDVNESNLGASTIWLIEARSSITSRFAANSNIGPPVWSPDGSSLVFTSGDALYRRAVRGSGTGELIAKLPNLHAAHDWSSDGRFVVCFTIDPKTRGDLWLVPMVGDHTPVPFVKTPFSESYAQVAPDSHAIAYATDETGRMELYVDSFPVPGQKRRVSLAGGLEPAWRRDGRELFYLAADQQIMAVDVRPGPTPDFGRPRPLFRAHLTGSPRNHYAVTADGQRFLVATTKNEPTPITVLLNWTATLRR